MKEYFWTIDDFRKIWRGYKTFQGKNIKCPTPDCDGILNFEENNKLIGKCEKCKNWEMIEL